MWLTIAKFSKPAIIGLQLRKSESSPPLSQKWIGWNAPLKARIFLFGGFFVN